MTPRFYLRCRNYALLILVLATSVMKAQDTSQHGYIKRPNSVYYHIEGVPSVGHPYQPSKRLYFYGTDDRNEKPQMIITFGDTIYIQTTVPVDKSGKLIIDWTNEYYDWYVDSLKKEIKRYETLWIRMLIQCNHFGVSFEEDNKKP